MYAAEDAEETNYGQGGRICECCGSQTVTDLKIDTGNRGITFELSDKKSDLKDTDNFKVQSFEINGVWFNFKLNQKHERNQACAFRWPAKD